MDNPQSGIKKGLIAAWALSLVAVMVLTFFAQQHLRLFGPAVNTSESSLQQQLLLSQMRTSLLSSVIQEKNAVIAVSDEDSQRFADLSLQASKAVDRDRRNLEELANHFGSDDEMQLLQAFDNAWNGLKSFDRTILELAVQHTNLKATSLSTTMGNELLKKLEEDLNHLSEKVSPPARKTEMAKAACQVVNAALKISSLETLHINESGEEKKSLLEMAIQNEEIKARASLKTLDAMTGKKSRPYFRDALTNFDEFMHVNEEVIRLSRVNSDNKAIELSTEKKQMNYMACDNILKALQAKVLEKKSVPPAK